MVKWSAYFLRLCDNSGPQAVLDALPSAFAKWPDEKWFIAEGSQLAIKIYGIEQRIAALFSPHPTPQGEE